MVVAEKVRLQELLPDIDLPETQDEHEQLPQYLDEAVKALNSNQLVMSRVTMTFQDSQVEDEFLIWSAPMFMACTAASITGAAAFLAASAMYSLWENAPKLQVLQGAGFVVLICNAVVNYAFCVQGNNSTFDSARVRARLYEGTCFVFLMSLAFGFACGNYLEAEHCQERCVREGCHRRSYDACVGVNPPFIIVQFCAMTLMPVRSFIAVPIFLLSSLMLMCMRFAKPVDTFAQYQASSAVTSSLTILSCCLKLALEHQQRTRFLTHVEMKRSEIRAHEIHAPLQEALDHFLPPSVLKRLSLNEPVFDTRTMATIGICDIFDFDQWSTTVMPDESVDIVATLFTAFDQISVMRGVEKVKSLGDRYVFSVGLRVTECPKNHAARALLLAGDLITIASRIGTVLGSDVEVPVQVAVHSGPCFGAIIGGHSLQYDVFGSCLTIANQLLALCPRNIIVASHVTCDLCAPFLILQWEDCGTVDKILGRKVYVERERSEEEEVWEVEDLHPMSCAAASPNEMVKKKKISFCFEGSLSSIPLPDELLKQRTLFLQQVAPSPLVCSVDSILSVDSQRVTDQLLVKKISERTGSWFSVEFADPELTTLFRKFAWKVEQTEGFLGSLYLALTSAVLAGAALEVEQTVVGECGLALVAIIAVVHGLSRSRWDIPLWELVVPLVLCVLIHVFLFLLNPCVVSNHLKYLNAALITTPLLAGCRLHPTWIFLGTTFGVAVPNQLAFSLVMDEVGWFWVVFTLLTLALAHFFIYIRHQQLIALFRNTLLRQQLLHQAEVDLSLHQCLIKMIIPSVLMKRVLGSRKEQLQSFVVFFDDTVVLRLRLDGMMKDVSKLSQSNPEAALRHVQRELLLVGRVLGQMHHLILTNTSGDIVTVAGPLDFEEEAATLARSTSALRAKKRVYDTVVAATVEVVKLIVAFKMEGARPFSAAVSVGSTVGAFFGFNLLRFDLLGIAMRHTRALMAAAPNGFIGVSSSVLQTLKNGRVKLPPGVKFAPPSKWRVRGLGVVMVSMLQLQQENDHSETSVAY